MGVVDFLRRQKEELQAGWQAATQYMTRRAEPEIIGETVVRSPDYRHSIFDPRFNKAIRGGEKIVTETGVKQLTPKLTTPAEFTGAYAARLLTDVGTDSTRQFYWRYNHPMALAEKTIEQFVPEIADIQNPAKRAAITLGITAPVAASLGTFDITNPGELFRPKGYAQRYSEEGSEDRRETVEPGIELFDRFFLGRRGEPLKYETAKEDIPDLTPERYKKVLQSQYQDRGVLGLGIVKGTTENIEGYPEVRIVGFPVGLQSAGALAGGIVGAQQAFKQPGLTTRGRAGVTLAGSLAGALLGNLTNKAIASAQNNPEKLPSTYEYQQNM